MNGQLGTIVGKQVVESRAVMHWRAIYVTPDRVFVGEFGHLRHILALHNILQSMRDDLRKRLDEFSAWVDRQTLPECGERSQFGICHRPTGHAEEHATYVGGGRDRDGGREMWFHWIGDSPAPGWRAWEGPGR